MTERAEFIQAVIDFKREYNGKLKDLLNADTNSKMVNAFLANPIIHSYLGRPSVSFIDKHPKLYDAKGKFDKNKTDYYELKIYKYLPQVVLFRDKSIIKTKFYLQGTLSEHRVFDPIINSFNQGLQDIKVLSPRDIYSIATAIREQRFLNKSGVSPRFLIIPNWKDGHATMCISVLDPLNGRPLVTLFMNSCQSKEYYNYTKERFLKWQSVPIGESRGFRKNLINYLNSVFEADINEVSLVTGPTKLLINQDKGIALNLNNKDYDSEEFISLRNTPDIDTLFNFEMGEDEDDEPVMRISMEYAHPIPLIDVSHDLQLDKNDGNCALYSMNFTRAVVDMLEENAEVADRVFELACSIKNDPDAIEALTQIFQEDLKVYLPYYYDSHDNSKKSCADLEKFHLNQRWKLGATSLSILHPIDKRNKVNFDLLFDNCVEKEEAEIEIEINDPEAILKESIESKLNMTIEDLSKEVNSPYKLSVVLQALTFEEADFVLNHSIKNKLSQIIINANHLYDVFYPCSHAVRGLILKALAPYLHITIMDTNELCKILNLLSTSEQRAFICNALMFDLPEMIDNAEALREVLYALFPHQRLSFCRALEKHLPRYIVSQHTFLRVLETISKTKDRMNFLKMFEKDFKNILEDASDFYSLSLLHDEKKFIFESCNIPYHKDNRWPISKIQAMLDFNRFLDTLAEKTYKSKKRSEAASTLHTALINAREAFIANPRDDQTFKADCRAAIKAATPMLSAYRTKDGKGLLACSVFLSIVSALSCLLLIPIPFVLGMAINNYVKRHSIFAFLNTESKELTNGMKSNLCRL